MCLIFLNFSFINLFIKIISIYNYFLKYIEFFLFFISLIVEYEEKFRLK